MANIQHLLHADSFLSTVPKGKNDGPFHTIFATYNSLRQKKTHTYSNPQ